MEVDFEREQLWWNAKAHKEERDLADEAINRALRWRVIERHLDGIETILYVGGGTGAFSIPLAERRFTVTHVGFSSRILDLAREKAGDGRFIQFVYANATNLSRFADCSFDLVLNMDGAISFSGSQAEKAILESVRVTRKKLIVTVTNRALMSSVFCSAGLEVSGRFVDALLAKWERGEWHQSRFADNPQLSKRTTQDYCGALKAFLRGELRGILEGAGMKVVRCGGQGSLALLCGRETADRVTRDAGLFEHFVDLCERYDRKVMPDGQGTRQRAGLVGVAEREDCPSAGS